MKVKKLLVVMILSLGVASTAYADTGSSDIPGWLQDLEQYLGTLGGDMAEWLQDLQQYLGGLGVGTGGSGHGSPMAAPEIDPASAGSALTLLGCGLAMIRGRRAKK